MNQKKVIIKKNSKERTVVYLEIRSKTIVVISCNDTSKNKREKKICISCNDYDDSRKGAQLDWPKNPSFTKKKIYLLKRGIKENDIIVILLMDIVLVWQMETRRKMHI